MFYNFSYLFCRVYTIACLLSDYFSLNGVLKCIIQPFEASLLEININESKYSEDCLVYNEFIAASCILTRLIFSRISTTKFTRV